MKSFFYISTKNSNRKFIYVGTPNSNTFLPFPPTPVFPLFLILRRGRWGGGGLGLGYRCLYCLGEKAKKTYEKLTLTRILYIG
jgi:hypothetical protein